MDLYELFPGVRAKKLKEAVRGKDEAVRAKDDAVREKDELEKQLKKIQAKEEDTKKALEEIHNLNMETQLEKMEKEKEILQLQTKMEALQQEKDILNSEKLEREEIEEKQKAFGWGTKTEMIWTPEEASRLREFLLQTHLDKEENEISMEFLVFGPTGHGKSSFCNGCRSAINNTEKPATYHQVAQISATFTEGFDMASYGNIWIIDMAGAFETTKIQSKTLEAIASGKVSFQAKISNTFEVENKEGEHCSESGENDLSCVVFVIKYDMELGPELKRQIEVIMKQAGKGVVSYHLVLTYLDECDPQFIDPENLKNIYKSGKVQTAVKNMSKQTGIPPYAISFVKNYTTELETNLNTTLQYLNVLDRILNSGLDQVEKRIEKKKHKDLYTKANTKTDVEERKSTQETGEEKDMKKTKGMDMRGNEKNGLAEKRMEDRDKQLSSCQTSNVTDMKTSLFVLLVAVIFMFFIWFD